MKDQYAKIGDVVFAGDLVTVLHGTKYYDIKYIGKNLSVVDSYKIYRSFDLLSVDDPTFLYWQIYNDYYDNGGFLELGLYENTCAFAHLCNIVNVVYDGNGGTTSYELSAISNTMSNELYYSMLDDVTVSNLTYITNIISNNIFVKNNHRFMNWKSSHDSVRFKPGDTNLICTDVTYYAQWMRLYLFGIANADIHKLHGYAVQLIPILSAHNGSYNRYDVGTAIQAIAYPNDNYHIKCWHISKLDADKKIESTYQQQPFEDNMLQTYLTYDTSVSAEFDKNEHQLIIHVIKPNTAIIDVSYGIDANAMLSDKLLDSKEYVMTYDNKIKATVMPLYGYKFLSWKGNVDPNIYNNLTLNITLLTNDIELSAMIGELDTYIVIGGPNYTFAGKVLNDADTELHSRGIYFEHENAQLSAVANDGFVFLGWFMNNRPLETEANIIVHSNNVTVIDVNANVNVAAKFNTYLIDADNEPIVDVYGDNIDYSGSDLTADYYFNLKED